MRVLITKEEVDELRAIYKKDGLLAMQNRQLEFIQDMPRAWVLGSLEVMAASVMYPELSVSYKCEANHI